MREAKTKTIYTNNANCKLTLGDNVVLKPGESHTVWSSEPLYLHTITMPRKVRNLVRENFIEVTVEKADPNEPNPFNNWKQAPPEPSYPTSAKDIASLLDE